MRLNFPRIILPVTIMLLPLATRSTPQQSATIDNKDINVVDYKDMGYPAIAFTVRAEGVVVVRVTLDGEGKVTDAQALSGPSLLVKASVENAKGWQFKPNQENAVVIVYDFRLEGSCHQGVSSAKTIYYPPNLVRIIGCPQPLSE